MPQLKPDIETYARIKVIGIGGGGGKAVTRMVNHKISGVEFIAVNTDAQDLHFAKAHTKIHIGKNATKGLGAGMNPELGKKAAEENRAELQEVLTGADLIFLTCGLGGGTGSGASPVIAELSRESGALTMGVVTKPFSFEGTQRARIAEEAWQQLKDRVDALITVENDRLFNVIGKDTPLLKAFLMCDEVLRQAVKGIADLITMPGIINVDFADIRAVIQETGPALLGVGLARGGGRAVAAAQAAVNSPLMDISISGAKGVLFNVSGGADLTMWEINEAAKVITESIDGEARVIFGAVEDDTLRKGEIKITVIATGFPAENHSALVREERIEVKPKSAPAEKEATPPEESGWDTVPAFLRRRTK